MMSYMMIRMMMRLIIHYLTSLAQMKTITNVFFPHIFSLFYVSYNI